jgi:hypothetical protein
MSSGTVSVYQSAVRKFFIMNDISLNWDRIHPYKGDNKKVAEDTHSESILLTENTKIRLRNRAILLLTPWLELYCTPDAEKT